MKFEVYCNQKPPEQIQFISMSLLTRVPSICGVNVNGEILQGGNIAGITPEGKLHLYSGCDVPGIQVDDKGRIKIDSNK